MSLNAGHLFIQFPTCQLRHLCIMNSRMSDDTFKNMRDSIKYNAHIENLELIGADFTDRIFYEMKEIIEGLPFLHNLKISHSPHIKGKEHFKVFLQKINENLMLENLDLSHNSMSEVCFSDIEDQIM